MTLTHRHKEKEKANRGLQSHQVESSIWSVGDTLAGAIEKKRWGGEGEECGGRCTYTASLKGELWPSALNSWAIPWSFSIRMKRTNKTKDHCPTTAAHRWPVSAVYNWLFCPDTIRVQIFLQCEIRHLELSTSVPIRLYGIPPWDAIGFIPGISGCSCAPGRCGGLRTWECWSDIFQRFLHRSALLTIDSNGHDQPCM